MRRGGRLGWELCLVGLWLMACNTTLSPKEDTQGLKGSHCQPMTCESQQKNCGVTIDGCGGTLHCGDCPTGEVCGVEVPNVCAPAPCQPGTCASLGKNCGATPDGCGGTLQCGKCKAPETCGGGGLANVCGQPVCTPTTCTALGKNCGTLSDGCGGTLQCGDCPEGETCGGGGAPNVCGKAPCQPATCASLGKNCGAVSDGCGGTLQCGDCPEGQSCGGGAVPNVCEGGPACTPATCASLEKNCGAVPDGCGGTLQCGDCPQGQTCGGGGTPNTCGTRACRPHSCGLMQKNCGAVADGCGGTLECGTCTAPESCGASGVSGVCYTSQPVCVDKDLGSALPATVKGTTAFGNDDHQLSCGGRPAPDRGFLWKAPKSGTFVFDTARSALHSLVAVRRGGCGGEELACATEGISYGGGALVTVPLEAGQQVLVVVDSSSIGSFGSGYFELHIDEKRESEAGACFDGRDNDADRWVDCADTDCQGEPGCAGSGCANQDLGSALPVTVQGETVDTGDSFQGTCGMRLQQDRAHLWTAPKSGTFVFDTAGSGWSNALYVLTGCRGSELACAPGTVGSRQAAVKLTLTQGQSVLVVVDGMSNDDFEAPIRYSLHINEHVPTEAGRCEDGADNDADGHADQRDPDCR